MKNKIIFFIAGYLALFSSIYFHELGHSIAYHQYGCKENIFDMHTPAYFIFSTPDPIDSLKVSSLNKYALFVIDIAGISVNIFFGVSLFFLLHFKSFTVLFQFYFYMFCLTNLLQAMSYLTINNIFTVSDMLNVLSYNSALQIPLFLLGLLLLFLVYKLIKRSPAYWQKNMVIYSFAFVVITSVVRVIYTFLNP